MYLLYRDPASYTDTHPPVVICRRIGCHRHVSICVLLCVHSICQNDAYTWHYFSGVYIAAVTNKGNFYLSEFCGDLREGAMPTASMDDPKKK